MQEMNEWKGNAPQMKRASEDVARLLSADLTEEDIRHFQSILNAVPENEAAAAYRDELIVTSHVMSDLSVLAEDEDIAALSEEYARKGQDRHRNSRYGWMGAIAATVVISVLGYTYLSNEQLTIVNSDRYLTRIGEQKSITLADKSEIDVNSNSALIVEFGKDFRHVDFVRGEAYFDVEPDPERPFRINMGDREVTVLGTEFGLRKQGDDFILSVVEGVVAVAPVGEYKPGKAPVLQSDSTVLSVVGNDQVIVQAGVVVAYQNEGERFSVQYGVDLSNRFSWRKGFVRFDNSPMSEVIEVLNRYSAIEIVSVDPRVNTLRLTATVRVKDVRNGLSAIAHSLPIAVAYSNGRLEIGYKE